MKKTTEVMHKAIGRAVVELRRRMNWGQAELARQISSEHTGARLAANQAMISQWEHGVHAPSPDYRIALSRIAARSKRTEDLAEFFRLPVSAWRVAAHWGDLPPVEAGNDDDQE